MTYMTAAVNKVQVADGTRAKPEAIEVFRIQCSSNCALRDDQIGSSLEGKKVGKESVDII